MHIIITTAIIVNILSIIMLLIGLLHNFEQPKSKAVYGYSIAGSFLLYIAVLSLVSIYGFVKHNVYSLILVLCIISPFIIGKLVKYETLKKYTVVQIICFVVSLFTMLIKF